MPPRRRSNTCRLMSSALFCFILTLVILNIIIGLRVSLPHGFRIRSFSSETLSGLLDQLFYVPETETPEITGNSSNEAVSDVNTLPSLSLGSINGIHDRDDEMAEEELYHRSAHKWQFAEDVAAELSVHRDEMVNLGTAFASAVVEMSAHGSPSTNHWQSAFSACAPFSEGSTLTRHDYSHRKKRAHEHRTTEYYDAVKAIVPQKALWTFSPAIPTVLNHFPIALSDDPKLNISQPFGSWKSVFYPVDDFMSQHQEADIPKYLRPPQVVEATPPLFAVAIENGLVSQGHLVTCDGHVLTAGGCLWEFSFKPSSTQLVKAKHVRVGIPLCDKWCNGYYHFTHEHLPRLALVHSILLDPNSGAMLVLSHSPNGFVRHFLFDILGIPRNRVMSGGHVAADIAVYPMPQRCGNTFTHLLHMMRAIVHNRLALSPVTNVTFENNVRKPHLLFAERSHLSRMPLNFYELKKQLMEEFKDRLTFSTTAGDTGLREQIGLFYKADIVLGPHGANLANMMWMRRGMHVIELASVMDGNMCYYATAGRVGLVHHLLLHGAGKDGRYTLDYTLFRQHVVEALRAVEQSIKEEQIFAV